MQRPERLGILAHRGRSGIFARLASAISCTMLAATAAPMRHLAMRLDPNDYLQLDTPQCLGATSAGATFATSSGDIVEIECFGDGAFRLRSGPNTRPDYGIVGAGPRPCKSDLSQPQRWSFDAGRAVLEISGQPLALRLLGDGRCVLAGATDRRADGALRLPAL